MSEEVENATGEGLDRRSVLKKAAIAGTVAWTAPVILSNTAFADVVCTPKCAHAAVTFSAVGQDACTTPIPEVPSGNKIILFQLLIPSGTVCPCDPNDPVVIVGSVPLSWDKYSPQTDGCPAFKTEYAKGIKTPSQGPNAFALYKNGALGSGVYVPNGGLCVSIKCLDTDGTPVYRKCTLSVCFLYSPEHAVCDTNFSVQTRVGGTSCVIACDPCPGSGV